MDGTHARALLGVPEHATSDQISRAFRGAAFVVHPDQGGDADRFRSLVAARRTLLAAAPVRRAPDPFTTRTGAPTRSTFSMLDQPRRRPAPAPAGPDPTPDFDRILADVLAAA